MGCRTALERYTLVTSIFSPKFVMKFTDGT